MPCESCGNQFTIFRRKRACSSCQRFYCNNCVHRNKSLVCSCCEVFLRKPPLKVELMRLRTKDLKQYLQSRNPPINIAGIVEKEELANLVINHVNSTSYYDGTHSRAETTPNEFDNYAAHSFDQIKQTCHNLFATISEKISSDFPKPTCFNQPSQQTRPTTEQPRPSPNPLNFASPRTELPGNAFVSPRAETPGNFPRVSVPEDCDCSEDEMNEISEKRQNIYEGIPGPSGIQQKSKIASSSSSDSSSFEEVGSSAVKLDNEKWQLIEKSASNGVRTVDESASSRHVPENSKDEALQSPFTEPKRVTRRRSDSSLFSMRKSSLSFDHSSLQNENEVKKLKISCNKCGKAKSNIKREILKLSEQLKLSNKSDAEVNAKIKEFLDYLESRSQPSELTETEESIQPSNQNIDDSTPGARFIPSSNSHDEIEENIFDEHEGINVYCDPQMSTSTPKRFIQLDDIKSNGDLETMSVKQLKEILMLNRVDFKGCCEKQELKERVERLWQDHNAALPSEKLPSGDLCKICMDAPIECVFLECGHTVTCLSCGKILSECPLCRAYIVRVVRIFKS